MSRRLEGPLRDALERVLHEYDSARKLASIIDNTLLSPASSVSDALKLINETHKYEFYCAMLSPYHIVKVASTAKDLGVKLCSVIGFPSGFHPLQAKLRELASIASEADEVDIVANIQALINNDYDQVEDELLELVSRARSNGVRRVKVIVEAPLLDDNTLSEAIRIVANAKADFAKTSTGVYSKGGDPLTVLRVSRLASMKGLRVKAAGGIRTGFDALLAIASGAHRIGTSSGPRVVETFERLIL